MTIILKSFIALFALTSASFAQELQLPSVPQTEEAVAPVSEEPQNLKPYIDDKLVVVGTGVVTGVYYPAGGAMCRLLNKERKELGVRCAVEATPGSIYNISALKNAEVDFAIIQSDWEEHAYNGTGAFAKIGRYDKLRHMFSLHNEAFTVVVQKKSEVATFDDIKGKIVNIGNEGSGVRATMEELMKAKNWSKSNFKSLSEFKPAEQAKALCDGRIDVMILATGHPNGLLQDVTSMCETRIINVDDEQVADFVRSNPEFSTTVIPGGMYNGNPMDITTFGVKANVVTSNETSEELAYNLTKVVFDNLDTLRGLHPVFSQLTREDMTSEGQSAPIHPGAQKYFDEKASNPTEN